MYVLWTLCAFVPAGAEDLGLTAEDCGKCHRDVSRDIAEAGLSHKTQVTCFDCHESHPPLQFEIIPECGMCHAGKPHFRLAQCLSCHVNPHRPLELSLGKHVTDPCLTCHERQGLELKEFQSFHSTLSCTSCHEKHRFVPECGDCHRPHSPDMVTDNCRACHQAHKPLAVVYDDALPSIQCASCHEAAYSQLKGSRAQHREVLCVTCHQNEHGAIPLCTDCHQPHSSTLGPETCAECHPPHAPVPAVFTAEVPSSSCGSCHGGTFSELTEGGTLHAELGCLDCHQGRHGIIPECASCHEPHSEAMTGEDCLACHQAHRPVPSRYGDAVPNRHCVACHQDALDLMKASGSRHETVDCVLCHAERHGEIPACRSCHEGPHSSKMLDRFPDCTACHRSAHQLQK